MTGVWCSFTRDTRLIYQPKASIREMLMKYLDGVDTRSAQNTELSIGAVWPSSILRFHKKHNYKKN